MLLGITMEIREVRVPRAAAASSRAVPWRLSHHIIAEDVARVHYTF